MSSLGSVCQSCTTPLRSLLYKTSGSRAEVVEVARLVPFETGVDTHKKPKRRTSTIQGATQCFAFSVIYPVSCILVLFFLLFLFFFFFLPGGEGVFGRALTKRAWMPPNQPEEKNKTNEKARKEEKGAGGAGGGQGVR